MARLVPARPRFRNADEEALGLALEAGLPDDFVVFQGRGDVGPGVLHPDLGVVALVAIPQAWRWDADAESWIDDSGVYKGDSDALLLSCKQALDTTLPGVSVPSRGLAVSLHHSAAAGVVTAVSESIAQALEETLRAGAVSIGDDGVSAVIEALSPGATPYERGNVTPAQASWREAGRPGAVARIDASGSLAQGADPVPPTSTGQAPRIVELASPGDDVSFVPVEPKETRKAEPERAVLRMVQACVENAADGRPLYVAGVEISPADVAAPWFMLPAILIAAAETWAPVVASRAGKGGFHIRLTPDPHALLGYRVAEISPSAPLLIFLPIVNLVRQASVKGECVLDGAVEVFARWLRKSDLDAEIMEDVDVRVATSV